MGIETKFNVGDKGYVFVATKCPYSHNPYVMPDYTVFRYTIRSIKFSSSEGVMYHTSGGTFSEEIFYTSCEVLERMKELTNSGCQIEIGF